MLLLYLLLVALAIIGMAYILVFWVYFWKIVLVRLIILFFPFAWPLLLLWAMWKLLF